MTSIEWLANLIKESDKKGYSLQLSKLDEWVKQAKEMHREEIVKARITAPIVYQSYNYSHRNEAEIYYNETFKQQ